MRNRARRIVGWLSADAITAEEAAAKAISRAQEVLGRAPGVLHLDQVTGRLTLLADVNAPIPPNTFVRGVRFDSDPDVLAEDLKSEALAARLMPRPNENGRPARAARRAA